MISFHPQPNEKGSGEWFHNDEWLDFNTLQIIYPTLGQRLNSLVLSKR